MDELWKSGEQKKRDIMADFPSNIAPPSRADHTALSQLYLAARAHATSITGQAIGSQLQTLQGHVTACIALWDLIRARRIARTANLEELYDARVAGNLILTSPRKQGGTPSKRQAKAVQDESDMVMLTQNRVLAELRHGRLKVEDVPDLCHFGEEISLRRMKISCAADVGKTKTRQLFP